MWLIFSLQRNGCLQCNIGTNHQASEWIFSATQSIKNLEWLFNFPKGELKYIGFCHISFGKWLHANDPISVSFLGLNLCKSIAMFISNNEVASKINIVKVQDRRLTKHPKNWNSFFSLSNRMANLLISSLIKACSIVGLWFNLNLEIFRSNQFSFSQRFGRFSF